MEISLDKGVAASIASRNESGPQSWRIVRKRSIGHSGPPTHAHEMDVPCRKTSVFDAGSMKDISPEPAEVNHEHFGNDTRLASARGQTSPWRSSSEKDRHQEKANTDFKYTGPGSSASRARRTSRNSGCTSASRLAVGRPCLRFAARNTRARNQSPANGSAWPSRLHVSRKPVS